MCEWCSLEVLWLPSIYKLRDETIRELISVLVKSKDGQNFLITVY